MDAARALPSPAAASAGAAPGNAAIRKTAADFEAVFVTQTLESMFSGVGANPLFGGGQGEAIYRSLLLQEYGKAVSRAGGFGVADAVQREMIRMQETK
jgi:flagellar protein FlgJ